MTSRQEQFSLSRVFAASLVDLLDCDTDCQNINRADQHFEISLTRYHSKLFKEILTGIVTRSDSDRVWSFGHWSKYALGSYISLDWVGELSIQRGN